MIQIHRSDRIDRIDQTHRIRAARIGSGGRLANIGNIRGQLNNHRHAGVGLDPPRHHFNIFGHLPDCAAHATLAHTMGAPKIQLDTISASVFHFAQDEFPRVFLAGHHQRDHHGTIGIVALDRFYLLQIYLKRPVGDQLDIVEPQQSPVRPPDCAISWPVHIDDMRIEPKSFPHDATPASFKGATDIIFLVCRRRRGQPKRVGRFNTDKICLQVRHFCSSLSYQKHMRHCSIAASVQLPKTSSRA